MRAMIRAGCVVLLMAGLAAAQDLAPVGVAAGSRLPPLSGVSLDGSPVDLGPLLGRNTVVLSFWSIHCIDCIRELDDLRAIGREFPPDDVTVVAVNTDSGLPTERIAGFVRRYEASRGALGVRHLLDRDAAIVDALGVSYIPVLVVVDRTGTVSSVLTGYTGQDRQRLGQAMEEGRVALGAWSEGLRGRLRTVLRGSGPWGRPVEWGSFRVEDGMPLYGLYDAGGWLADAAGRRDRAVEQARVEAVVADVLKVALLREAMASVGVQLPASDPAGHRVAGLRIPESPFAVPGRWERLYQAVQFDELVRVEQRDATWLGDEYWAGLVGDVDLGRLRNRLLELNFPADPVRVRVVTVSDFDYKPRAVLQSLRRQSYRVQAVQGEHIVYYGSAAQLADEVSALSAKPFKGFVEVGVGDEIRIEVY
ncbi:MAG TPA: TlpA disulfide reductase family protein [Deferrisomatales bacterium]|nr:TlpA disulfide reductase family protein [Deferrisomatales bacterium]